MNIQKRNIAQGAVATRPTPLGLGDEILELCQMPHGEMQAGVTLLFDKLNEIHREDPMLALQENIHLNQCINTEILKNVTTMLIAATTAKADHFARSGKLMPVSKAEEKYLAMAIKLQEASIHLSIANTKVSDEKRRRQNSNDGDT